MVKYCRKPAEPTKSKTYSLKLSAAKCRVDDLRTSYKNTYEVARAVRGMKLLKAIKYYEAVLDHKDCIPFHKYVKHAGRCAQAKKYKVSQGRWPEKSTGYMLQLLKNLNSNVESKGLDAEKCVITHFACQRAVQGRRRTYRAHGRITPYLSSNCHVEFFCTEKSEAVKKADDRKPAKLTKKQAAQKRLAIGESK